MRLSRDGLPQQSVVFQFGLLAGGQVGVGYQVRCRETYVLGLHSPAARHDELTTIARGLHELTRPAPGPRQLGLDLLDGSWELRLEQMLRGLPHGLLAEPPVELLGAPIPVTNATRANLPHQKRVGGQFEELSLNAPIRCTSGCHAGKASPSWQTLGRTWNSTASSGSGPCCRGRSAHRPAA